MANFSVAARTLVHLGAELITSDEVAINELIKNAFDAESPRVKVHFHVSVPHSIISSEISKVEVLRPGDGLAEELQASAGRIELSISNIPQGTERTEIEEKLSAFSKCDNVDDAVRILESLNYLSIEDSGSGMSKDMLENVFLRIGTPSRLENETSKKLHRKILGNKGIGRLAMMRLGDRASVVSWETASTANEIQFNWREFDDPSKDISDVSMDIRAVTAVRNSNSGTVITISALKSEWSDKGVREKLIAHFLRRLQNPFESEESAVVVDGQEDEMPGFPIDVHVNGGVRIPIEGMKKELTEHKQADFELVFDPFGIRHNGVNAEKRVSLTDAIVQTTLTDYQRGTEPQITNRTVEEVTHLVGATLEDLEKIGPIKATIRWFNRDKLKQQSTLHGNWKLAQEELNLWSGGVAIYRDGFRIGFSGQDTGEDWLGLDSSALKRSGFTVNRIQVVGALEISRANNPRLIDRSNREGLIESRESIIVKELINKLAIDELRRHINHEGREGKKAELDALVDSAPVAIRARVVQAEQGLSEIRARVSQEDQKTVRSIASHLHFIKGEVKRFEEASKQVSERREDILELAGVGTVMSGVLHELTRTTGHTRQLLQKLAKDESPQTKALLKKLDAEINAINTRLRQLDPLTPSGRHRKEDFDLCALLNTIVEGYAARFERHNIKCKLQVSGKAELEPVTVKMVRGFVSLAVENLITNSVYWLQRGLKAGETERCLTLELDPQSKTLTVSDNGPGISAADKDRVFTAGFSLRPRGQGLGLYIAAEVATYHDAKLVLDSPEDDSRYRSFVLELPKD